MMPGPDILIPAAVVGGIGAFCSVALAIASRYFFVAEDPRVEAVAALLPNANCGACGLAGCADYAKAIVLNGAPLDQCKPGGAHTVEAIAACLGVKAAFGERKVAVVMCAGDDSRASRKFAYNGLADCAAAMLVGGGDKTCSYGCLGLGSCARVCPAGAIEITQERIALVHPELCVGCGLCVKICPKKIIRLVPENRSIHVLCSSHERGPAVKKKCEVGCIGCTLCVKASDGAIQMERNLAVVDYEKNLDNDQVVAKCPQHTIVHRSGLRVGGVK